MTIWMIGAGDDEPFEGDVAAAVEHRSTWLPPNSLPQVSLPNKRSGGRARKSAACEANLGTKTEVSHGEGADSGAPSNWATP